MKKVLIAGSTGYLGRYLVKELKKRDYLVAAQLLDDNNRVVLIDAMNLEDILGEIDTDGLNLLHVDALSNDSRCNDPPTLAS